MNLIEHVAARLKGLRTGYRGQGLSQEALAKELGVATNTISRWETGTYKPALEDLDRLARFFKVSVLEFFPAPEGGTANIEVAALLRAAEDLSDDDVRELRRYAEFRRAQAMYRQEGRATPGRKRKE